jgi:hypothetical protein
VGCCIRCCWVRCCSCFVDVCSCCFGA